MAALDGLKILDLTQWEAGTSSTQMLAWLGADVVKVERPGVGDPGRRTEGEKDSIYFLSFNTNKRSLTLDLEQAEGKRLFLELVKRFDVVTENFTLGTMERLGLGYDTLRQVNPALIYGSIKGFAADGPYASFKCFDPVAQTAGGAVSVTGEMDSKPFRPGATYADTGSGMTLALQIVAAYVQRQRTGEGQKIEVAMQDAVANFMRTPVSFAERFGHPTPRRGNAGGVGGAPTDLFPCAPGGPNDYVYVFVNSSRFWDALAIGIGMPELASDPRFATAKSRFEHRAELYEIVAGWTRGRTKWEAMQILGEAGVPCSALYDTQDLLEHPSQRERGAVITLDHPVRGPWDFIAPPFRMSASPVEVRRAPLLGEHTADVLQNVLGISDGEQSRLREAGVTAPRRESVAADD